MCLNERYLSTSFVSTLNIAVWGESVCAKDVCSAFFFFEPHVDQKDTQEMLK